METEPDKDLLTKVELLRSKGYIRKDKQIEERTGYTKGQISNYLAGRVKPSKAFMKKFHEVFEKELSEINENKVFSENESYYLKQRIKDLDSQLQYERDNFRELMNLYHILTNSFSRLAGLGDSPPSNTPVPKTIFK